MYILVYILVYWSSILVSLVYLYILIGRLSLYHWSILISLLVVYPCIIGHILLVQYYWSIGLSVARSCIPDGCHGRRIDEATSSMTLFLVIFIVTRFYIYC